MKSRGALMIRANELLQRLRRMLSVRIYEEGIWQTKGRAIQEHSPLTAGGLKVALVTSGSFPPREGLGTHVFSLAKYLNAKGCDVTIFVRTGGFRRPSMETYESIRVTRIPSSSIPAISSFIFAVILTTIFRRKELDIIHYHSPLVIPARRTGSEKRPKVISTIHSTMVADTKFIEPISLHAKLNKLMGYFLSPLMERLLIKGSDKIISVSEGVAEELRNFYHVRQDKISTIVNAIDLEVFKGRGNRREGFILYLGRLGYRKGLPELFDAIVRYQRAGGQRHFVFGGDGPLSELLKRRISEQFVPDTVSWLGSLDTEGVADALASAEFLIMPSTYETGPRVVLEAMASGTPVIATKVGLVKDIDPEAYIPINDHTSSSIFDALQAASALSPQEYMKLSLRSECLAEGFSSENIYAKVLDHYRE
ncbi:glycosyltransferase [Erythrobacter vulgaris]|uniref:Glycosyltransferase n=1 Tax=Qipengyuania vulgaris TaxID=291985 RepID=A0A844XND0_9SPHN|nr:glycosyltransferase family 4 protein [Qipengyuania vulgaris]MXO47491.1 glycosyltransferase [Qipengyuania vulgaris]